MKSVSRRKAPNSANTRRKKNDGLGPIEAATWPNVIPSNLLDGRGRVRLQGYDVVDDLSRHYSESEIFFALLGGRFPTRRELEYLELAFAVAIVTLTPGHASIHGGKLARLTRARPAAIAGAAATIASDEAQRLAESVVDARPKKSLLLHLERSPRAFVAAETRTRSVRARNATQLLRGLLEFAGLEVSVNNVLQVVLRARLPVILAEVFYADAISFKDYPMRVPDYEYVGARS